MGCKIRYPTPMLDKFEMLAGVVVPLAIPPRIDQVAPCWSGSLIVISPIPTQKQ